MRSRILTPRNTHVSHRIGNRQRSNLEHLVSGIRCQESVVYGGWVLILCLAIGSSSAQFATAEEPVYDNGVSWNEIDNARLSDSGGNPNSVHFSGDEFILDSETTITAVEWSGIYWASNTPPAVDQFTIKLYDYSDTKPSGFAFASFDVGDEVGRTDTGFDFSIGSLSSDIYSYSASLTPITLPAGRYLLLIHNNTADDSDDSWFWSYKNGVSGIDESFVSSGSGWSNIGGGGSQLTSIHDFRLFSNSSPVANAGDDQVVNCTAPDGSVVTLDGTGSSDPDGDTLTYEWSVPDGVVLDDPTSPTPIGLFPIGITTATLTVTDGNGGLDVDDVEIVVIDETPPEVACTTSHAALWPPDHSMRAVEIYIDATDHCTSPGDLRLDAVTIQSNEPENAEGSGDGETTGDTDGEDGYTAPVDVTDYLTFNPETASFEGTVYLRAERHGDGYGRTYSINARVLDSSDNLAETSCVVIVPHDRRKKK